LSLLFPPLPVLSSSEREKFLNQKALVVWLTGLSGSGKSTLAQLLDHQLLANGFKSIVIDGDVLRKGLNSDLGFSVADRTENIRRAGELSRLAADSGLIVITSFISPFRSDREMVRSLIGKDRFAEIYINAPIELCEKRDPKGLYQKARTGELTEFTGISSPYEVPEQPDLEINTGIVSVNEALESLVSFVFQRCRLV
jgi:adenylyl-sulfate kinase